MALMPKKRVPRRVKMRRDIPYVERKYPVGSAMPGSVIHEMDALAETQGVGRSEFILRAVRAQLEIHRATKAA